MDVPPQANQIVFIITLLSNLLIVLFCIDYKRAFKKLKKKKIENLFCNRNFFILIIWPVLLKFSSFAYDYTTYIT